MQAPRFSTLVAAFHRFFTFSVDGLQPNGTDHWVVHGNLDVSTAKTHTQVFGQTSPSKIDYIGARRFSEQKKPIRDYTHRKKAAGGTVKVKDEVNWHSPSPS